MTVFWYCQTCPACGEGDKQAEQHVRGTQHTVETRSRPRTGPVARAIPFTLTDAGWAVVGGRTT